MSVRRTVTAALLLGAIVLPRSIAGQGAASASAAGQAEEICVELTPLGPVTRNYHSEVLFSPDYRRAAVVEARGTTQVVMIDGQEGPAYASLTPPRSVHLGHRWPIAFSPDSESVVYVADRGGGEYVVVQDGREGPIYDDILSVQYAPAGHRLAYIATKSLSADELESMSPAQQVLAIGHAERTTVVVDGQPGPAFGKVENFTFSPDGKRYAYVGFGAPDREPPTHQEQKEGKMWAPLTCHVVVDGEASPRYGAVKGLTFSKDSSTSAYAAQAATGDWHIVIDGEPGPAFAQITPLDAAPDKMVHLTDDGRHHAYVAATSREAKSDTPHVLVLNGRTVAERVPQGRNHPFQLLTISPDGQRWASMGEVPRENSQAPRQWYIDVDGEEKIVNGDVREIRFSPDSRHLVYLVNLPGRQVAVVHDGVEYGPYGAVSSLHFSPDGSRLAFITGDAKGGRTVVINGEPGPSYRHIDEESLRFDEAGRIVYSVADHHSAAPRLVVDHEETGREALISPDGSRSVALQETGSGTRKQLFVDDEPLGSAYFDISQVQFSNDGEHIAAVARQSGSMNQKRVHHLVDGVECPGHWGIEQIAFTPKGNRLVSIVETEENINGSSARVKQVLVSGVPIGAFEDVLVRRWGQSSTVNHPQIAQSSLQFDADGSLRFLAVRDGALHRVVVPAPSLAAAPPLEQMLARLQHEQAVASGEIYVPTQGLNRVAEGIEQPGVVIVAEDGTMYGATAAGGKYGQGYVFRLDAPREDPQTLYDFLGRQHDGNRPEDLLLGPDGALYGTLADAGQHNGGSLYRLEADGSDFKVLRHFDPREDGRQPRLICIDAQGALFGVTDASLSGSANGGKLFRLSADGEFSILYDVQRLAQLRQERDDAAQQVERCRERVESYEQAGQQSQIEHWKKLLASAEEELAQREVAFEQAGGDDCFALGPMIDGGDGYFYGVTNGIAYRDSTHRLESHGLFKIKRDGSGYTVLHQFEGPPLDGERAHDAPMRARDGVLFGVATGGGISGDGVVYSFDPRDSKYTVLFNPQERVQFAHTPVEGPDGDLYARGRGPRENGSGSTTYLYQLTRDGGDLTAVEELESPSYNTNFIAFHDGDLYGVTGLEYSRGKEQIVAYLFDAPVQTVGAGGPQNVAVREINTSPAPLTPPDDVPAPTQAWLGDTSLLGQINSLQPSAYSGLHKYGGTNQQTLEAEEAITYDGMRIEFTGDKEDITELVTAAISGNTRACLLLGELTGQGKIEGGATVAFAWFLRGHWRGDAECTARLVLHLLMGRGVDANDPRRDPKTMRDLARRASNQRSPLGMYLYAECLGKGIGGEPNERQAQGEYIKAARAGHPLAIKWCDDNDVKY